MRKPLDVTMLGFSGQVGSFEAALLCIRSGAVDEAYLTIDSIDAMNFIIKECRSQKINLAVRGIPGALKWSVGVCRGKAKLVGQWN